MIIKWCSSFGIYDTEDEDEMKSNQYSLSPDYQFFYSQFNRTEN